MNKKNKKKCKKKWIKKLDALISKIIKADGRCEMCGKKDVVLNCAHIYSRRNKAVRWDLRNVLALCVRCHFYTHQNPLEFVAWLKKRFGLKYLLELEKEAHKAKNWSVKELQDLYKKLKKHYDNTY